MPREYLDTIRPYLSNMVNDHKTIREQKIQMTMQINFILHKDFKETCTLCTKSHNIEIMEGDKRMKLLKNFWSLSYRIIQKI